MRGSAAEAKTVAAAAAQPQLQTPAAAQTQLHVSRPILGLANPTAEQHAQAEACTPWISVRKQLFSSAQAAVATVGQAPAEQAEPKQEEALSWETLLANSPPLPPLPLGRGELFVISWKSGMSLDFREVLDFREGFPQNP